MECTQRGGYVSTVTYNGCPYPTCAGGRPCPTFSFPLDSCISKGGYSSNVVRSGCPTPTCVTECWADKLGYPCCKNSKNTSVIYTDEDGDWGLENGQWCGIHY